MTMTARLHSVKLDCPCGLEIEVICRLSGRSHPITYADSREVEVVSVQCESGHDLSREAYDVLAEEATAIAYDDMTKMEEGYDQ